MTITYCSYLIFKPTFQFLGAYDFQKHTFKTLFKSDGEIEFVDEVAPNEHVVVVNNSGISEVWFRDNSDKKTN